MLVSGGVPIQNHLKNVLAILAIGFLTVSHDPQELGWVLVKSVYIVAIETKR